MAHLTAGYACTEITPPLGLPMAGYGARDQLSQSIEDPLYAQALVLQAGAIRCAIICADLIGLKADVVAQIRERAQELTGIPDGHITICCSHTHWGPVISEGEYLTKTLREAISAEYCTELIEKLAQIVAQADQARVPAVAGWGSGFASGISFNRRQVSPEFKTAMHLVLGPPLAELASAIGNELALSWHRGEHLGPRLSEPLEELEGRRVGPADADVLVLRLDKTDGAPLAALVNFACHPVCGGGDFYGYSADFVGYARLAFEKLTGCPMLFANGCAGDIVPRWRQQNARFRIGTALGAEAAKAYLSIDECRGDVKLALKQAHIFLPFNPNIPSVAEAQAALEAHPQPESTDAVSLRHALHLARLKQDMSQGYPAEIGALRLGEGALVTMPGEVLVEIGLQIKQRSPFEATMPISLANGSIGYLPTDNACYEGGYEPEWSPVGAGTERVLVHTALQLLEELA